MASSYLGNRAKYTQQTFQLSDVAPVYDFDVLRPKAIKQQGNQEEVMYTGTMIEELIESVQRAEIHADAARRFAWGTPFEQSLPANIGAHAFSRNPSIEKTRVEVA